jgi:hypothetical protein
MQLDDNSADPLTLREDVGDEGGSDEEEAAPILPPAGALVAA